jgi:hypothetical protein
MPFFRRILLASTLSFLVAALVFPQTVRIMPMGNSITYDNNSLDVSNPRPPGQRISYRYKLYQLLMQEGFVFDFVGSEDSGNDYFQDPQMDDNAGFPGVQSWELADLIVTGWDNFGDRYVSPGPYLNYFPTDIILLHIGTNNLTTDPSDVEEVLDKIRIYDPDVIILVARIINRKVYHPATTTFNNNVEIMVNNRGDSRIKMVNLETGAGINYSTEMVDTWHPTQSGYDKMAQKWFEAIIALNNAPVVTQIPTQNCSKGESFPDIVLDPYVSDAEDPDFLIAWTYQTLPDTHLNISVDASRIMHVTPDPDWSGSETIKLKASDSGNGAFIRSDSVYVTFNVDHVNTPPEITSTPPESVLQSDDYSYTLEADDVDQQMLYYSAIQIPGWLSFNESSHVLSGTPEDADVGYHSVVLEVSDGEATDDQQFTIEVIDTNDPPQITSPSEVEGYEDIYFTFRITAVDPDGDPFTCDVSGLPDWLDYASSSHILTGKPSDGDIGVHTLTVAVSDGTATSYQQLRIIVNNVNDLPVITSTPEKTAVVNESYIYRFTAEDVDPDDTLTFSYLNMPGWLNWLTSSKDALLYGSPTEFDVGSNLVVLQVSDGIATVQQGFIITVSYHVSIGDTGSGRVEHLYPNPATDRVFFELNAPSASRIEIVDMAGSPVLVREFEAGRSVELDISALPAGIYMYRAVQDGALSTGKFIKN